MERGETSAEDIGGETEMLGTTGCSCELGGNMGLDWVAGEAELAEFEGKGDSKEVEDCVAATLA